MTLEVQFVMNNQVYVKVISNVVKWSLLDKSLVVEYETELYRTKPKEHKWVLERTHFVTLEEKE